MVRRGLLPGAPPIQWPSLRGANHDGPFYDKNLLTNDKFMSTIHSMDTPRDPALKVGSTVFLQVVVALIGFGALALLLWEPHLEGRNAHATVFQIYFDDPFLAYVYLGSIAFFVALYQAFKLLGHVRRKEVFSQESVRAVRTIKHCAMTLVAFVLGAEAYFFVVRRSKEDIAGGVMMGLLLILVSAVVSTAAAVFERTLQSAVDMKSENDLTV